MAFNAARLELARKRRGFTKRGLAEASGIRERTLVAYLNGERQLPDNAADQLSRVLRFPKDFFFRDDPEELPGESVSFRAMSRMTAAQRDRATAAAVLALELNAWIEERFVLPDPDLLILRPEQDPESAANALRSYWCLGDHPISNMVHLLEAKGVRVFSLAEECRELDAFSFWRGDRPFVFLNTAKSAERSRFDAAHELGHLVLHSHGPPSGRKAEWEADRFAAAFLMPRSSVLANRPKVVGIPSLVRAKHVWGVAPGALAHRLHEIGVLSEWHYRRVCIDIQAAGMRTKEPEPWPRETSQVLAKIFAALREDGISKKRIAEELAWPLAELEALVFGLVVSLVPGDGRAGSKPSARPPLRLI